MKAATKFLPSITDYDCYLFSKAFTIERIQLFMKAYHEGRDPVLLWSQMIPIYKLNNNDEKESIKGFFDYLFFSNNCIPDI
jgi:hypothetical protein